MPSKKYHIRFDHYLKDRGVICEETDGATVHERLDKHARRYGADHRWLDPWHSPDGIRDFLDNLMNSLGTINQDTCTDYVRIAYGHICLDETASRIKGKEGLDYNELDWDDVIRKTWMSYKRHGYHRTYYKF